MKQLYIILFPLFIISLSACSDNKPSSVNLDLIEFDVTQEYPQKELDIHEIADVSYIILEVEEDFLFNSPIITLTDNFIIATHSNAQGFVFFDRTGKPVSQVYRKGEGPEEYVRTEKFLYVEEEDNFYVVSWLPQDNPKIRVYSKDGIFKRDYSTPENMRIEGIYNYDKNSLLLYFANQQVPFGIFSKIDGSTTFLTDVFIEKPEDMLLRYERLIERDGTISSRGFFYFSGYYAVKNGKDILLTAYALDTTIYRMTPDKQISPAVIRKPSFRDTEPMIALHSFVETSKYMFFSGVRMEYDQETFTVFPKKTYLIDKNNRQIYSQYITNKDFEKKNLVIDPSTVNTFLSPSVGKVHYHIDELTQADKEGRLKGKLKETYDQMGKEDEYVFMLFELH